MVGMPEAYWAAIATLVIMQSSLGATLKLSVERIVASALGASLGAPACDIFHVTGIDCGCFHLSQRFSLTGLGPRDFFDTQNGRQIKLTETQCLHAKFTSSA
jgi:hypothetical protein